MDIGDFIFFFIFILVILGRVLSWIFKQFVENSPNDNTENTNTKPQSIKDYIFNWIRMLEDRIDTNQWSDRPPRTGKKHLIKKHYEKLETPVLENVKQSDTNFQHRKVKKAPPVKRRHNKMQCKLINIKKAMIHYEILSPPISLRQEYHYDRQF